MYKIEQNQKIISISSGLYHSLALTDNGDVYYWGNHSLGKFFEVNWYTICYENRRKFSFFKKNSWSKVQNLNEISITKIVCGPYHSLLLSTNGDVYCFGENNCGQCGDGTNEDITRPTKIEIDTKFVDIGATKRYDISVGLAENGFCYVWGCRVIKKPYKVENNNISDVIESYSYEKFTYEPIIFKEHSDHLQNKLIIDRTSEKFNKQEYSDIVFIVDGKNIYAQKTHLINVCLINTLKLC